MSRGGQLKWISIDCISSDKGMLKENFLLLGAVVQGFSSMEICPNGFK